MVRISMESQRWREVRQRDRSGWKDGQRETERKRGRGSSRRHRDQEANADGLKCGEWGCWQQYWGDLPPRPASPKINSKASS